MLKISRFKFRVWFYRARSPPQSPPRDNDDNKPMPTIMQSCAARPCKMSGCIWVGGCSSQNKIPGVVVTRLHRGIVVVQKPQCPHIPVCSRGAYLTPNQALRTSIKSQYLKILKKKTINAHKMAPRTILIPQGNARDNLRRVLRGSRRTCSALSSTSTIA